MRYDLTESLATLLEIKYLCAAHGIHVIAFNSEGGMTFQGTKLFS
jgi:hypothetical protein